MSDKPMIVKSSTGIYHLSRNGKDTYCATRIDLVVDVIFTGPWSEVPTLKMCRHCDRTDKKIAKANEMPEARKHAQDLAKLKKWVEQVKS